MTDLLARQITDAFKKKRDELIETRKSEEMESFAIELRKMKPELGEMEFAMEMTFALGYLEGSRQALDTLEYLKNAKI